MKKLIASAAVLVMAGTAAADTISTAVNVVWAPSTAGGTEVATATITLPEVASIDSIVLDLSHTWGGDLDVSVDAPGGATVDFDLMFAEEDLNGDDFEMGATGNGFLNDVAPYIFVASGGSSFPMAGLAPSGNYNANSWISGPLAGGEYVLHVADLAFGDGGAIGTFTINYTVPDPVDPPCEGDANGDGTVNLVDLITVLLQLGECDGCSGDINGDGVVNMNDLIAVLLNWGQCDN